MMTWVIRKALTSYATPTASGKVLSPVTLYWAGPQWPRRRHRFAHMTSWVWLTGLDRQVAGFATRREAQAVAEDFAGQHWQGAGMDIVQVDLPGGGS